jgi:hypothetical protein|tara:strand:- start:17056 stop:17586 length:531 start_codon:yes stop_codon:yes gene_type:complete
MGIEFNPNKLETPVVSVPVLSYDPTVVTKRPVTKTEYDIDLVQGDSFSLDVYAGTTAGISFGLHGGYTASMQIKRSSYSDKLLAELTTAYPRGSFGKGTTGDFSSGSGVTSSLTGGISMDYNGVAGTIRIEIDSYTSGAIPRGKHPYDLQIRGLTTGVLDTILFGRINVQGNVSLL